MILKFIDSDHG